MGLNLVARELRGAVPAAIVLASVLFLLPTYPHCRANGEDPLSMQSLRLKK